MTGVRCPSCRHITTEPPQEYDCPSCGQKLRRRDGLSFAVPVQLGLFGEAVPVEQVAGGGPRRPPSFALSAGGRWQSTRQSEQDAIAAITALYHRDEGRPGEALQRAESILVGKAAADLRESALAAAWFATTCLDVIDRLEPGWGAELLRTFALHAASTDEQ